MKRSSMILLVAGGLACGDSTVSVQVEMTASPIERLNPFAPQRGLDVVQVVIEGTERGEDTVLSVPPDMQSVTLSEFPVDGDEVTLTVRAEGLDAQGSLIAFGRAPSVTSGDDVSVSFPLRRNIAYVTHQLNANQANPERFVYAIDLATRSLVEKIRIAGNAPIAEWITARGGDSLLVTYRDGVTGYLGILSAEDHTWRTIELSAPQTVAVGVEGQPVGVVAGNGFVTFVDLDAQTVIERVPPENGRLIGGTVLDGVISGDGRSALFVLGGGVTTGTAIFVDVENRTIEPLDVLPEPSGVALSPDGRVAFVTSSGAASEVAEVDLRSGRVARANGFAKPVKLAAYSENMQAVLALDAGTDQRQVLALLPRANCPEDISKNCGQALPVRDATPTTLEPVDLSADGVGRQILVIGRGGTSTTAAGLTLIETFEGVRQLPVASRTAYPGDPDDTFLEGQNLVGRQRYQPRSVSIIYGR